MFDSSCCAETEQTCVLVDLIDLSRALMLLSIQRRGDQTWHPSFMAPVEFDVFWNVRETGRRWEAAGRCVPDTSQLFSLFPSLSFHRVNTLHPC